MPNDETPEADAQAVLGDATVVEAGATDASTETVIDDSTHVEVIMPPAESPEPAAPAEAHCPHCEEHASRIAALESRIEDFMREIQEVEEQVEEESTEESTEEVVPPTPTEEIAPRRRSFWYDKIGGHDDV